MQNALGTAHHRKAKNKEVRCMNLEGKVVSVLERTGTRLNNEGEEVEVDEKLVKIKAESFLMSISLFDQEHDLKIGQDVQVEIKSPQKKLTD